MSFVEDMQVEDMQVEQTKAVYDGYMEGILNEEHVISFLDSCFKYGISSDYTLKLINILINK